MKDTRVFKHILLATGGVIFIGVPGTAGAAPPVNDLSTQSPPTAGGQTAVTDIIVTAERRNEKLSRTPVSVSVVSSDTLKNADITTENDLHTIVPGLSIRSTSNSNQINYAIRGQSKDAFSGTRPGVLPYVNEVQIGGEGSTVFYDLKSIQVLEGPQGTLFGRSATGGAVLLTTEKPTDHLEGYGAALIGNYNTRKLEGAISGPIAGDQLMARVAGYYEKRDGYQTNLFTGNDVGGLDRYAVRGSLSANAGIVHDDLMVDYFHSNSQNTQGVISGIQSAGAQLPLSLLYSGTATPVQRATGIAVFQGFTGLDEPTAAAAYDAYFANPHRPAVGLAGYLAQQQAQGPYKIETDTPNLYRANNIIVTNGTNVDLGNNLTLRNILGVVSLHTFTKVDQDGTPYGINSANGYRLNTRQFSDELQLQGTALSGRMKYAVGGYFSDEKQLSASVYNVFDILFGGSNGAQNFTLKNTTYAGYGQATLNLNDQGLSTTLGLRYTSEKVGIAINPGDSNYVLAQGPGYALSQSTTYNKLSWQIGLQDQINNDLFVYAVSRRAYKSGGYNGGVTPLVGSGANGGDGFGAERVTDAEVGAKLNGRIAGMPAHITTSLYYDWVKDAQRTSYTIVNAGPASVTLNVPDARLYGAEFQASLQPAQWLSVGGSFDYFHAKLSGSAPGLTALTGCSGATVNSNGQAQCFDQYADTPRNSGSVFADITAPLTTRLSLLVHGDAYIESRVATSPQSLNAAGTTIASYTLANFRLGVQDSVAGWSITANLKNAFNRVFYVGGIPSGLTYQVNTLIPGDPRTFTVEARIKF